MFPSNITTRRGAARFTVMQLNTLGRFHEPLQEVLQRQSSLYDHLLRTQPTIAALEEVPTTADALEGNKNIPEALMAACPHYKQIAFAKETERGDMTCVLYDSRIFEAISVECFRFGGLGSTLPSSQFAIIIVLRLKHKMYGTRSLDDETARSILFVAQHAKAGRNSECEGVRLEHTRRLFDHLLGEEPSVVGSVSVAQRATYAKLVKEGKFVWAGDFNAGPHAYKEVAGNEEGWPCDWYDRVIKRSPPTFGARASLASGLPIRTNVDDLFPSQSGWENKVIPLLSTMTIAHGGCEPPFTTHKYRDGKLLSQCIDYIFMSRGSSTLSLVGVSSPATPFEDGSAQLPQEGFPCTAWGSDHLPLLCELEFKEALPPVLQRSDDDGDRCGRH